MPHRTEAEFPPCTVSALMAAVLSGTEGSSANLLRLYYLSQEPEIAEAMDLFASLPGNRRQDALYYLKALQGTDDRQVHRSPSCATFSRGACELFGVV